jgi:hypothetical protein
VVTRRQALAIVASAPASLLLGNTEAHAAPWVRTDSTVRTWGNVMLIGDSTAAGYRTHLVSLLRSSDIGPYRCDLQAARSMHREFPRYPSAVRAVRSARRAGFDPSAYVIAVGANDLRYGTRTAAAATTMFDTLLGAIGADRTVGICTIYGLRSPGAVRYNRYLAEATTRWPNLHILHWAPIARRHREWHQSDGFHYNLRGSRHRNVFLVNAMREMAMVEAARHQPPPVDPGTTDPGDV